MNKNDQQELPNWLHERAQAQPAQPALYFEESVSTWQQLYSRSMDWAGRLAGLGIGAGNRVALLLGNTQNFVEIIHAVMQLRAVLVPLNLRLSGAELGWQLADVGATILLYDDERSELALAVQAEVPRLPAFSLAELDAQPVEAVEPPAGYQSDALHTIIYSSGTTGHPKGVRLTYGNHFANAAASAHNLPASPQDLWLAVLPLFHVGGLAIVLRGLFYAMPVLLFSHFEPAAINRALDECGVTLISVVTNMLMRLLDERQDRPYPPSLRCFLIGGGPVPAPLLERCARAAIPVIQTYGMTETASQTATLSAADALRKLGSAGQPLPGVAIAIEREGQAAPTGEVGEIILRGPNISPGYDNRPEATEQAWRGGWFHTGDMGRLDEEGFLYVVDRRTDLIISGGENVYPAEIEAVLLSHPAILEAGVVGAPDPRWGQVPVAFVRLRPETSASEADLLEYSTSRLARYKVPRHVYFAAEPLPRNATGKLLRRTLRDWLENSRL